MLHYKVRTVQICINSESPVFLFFLFYIVPTPDLSIRLSTDNFIAGSGLTITCDVIIDPHVNTPFIVNTTWIRLNNVSSGMGTQLDNIRTEPEILRDNVGSGQSRISLNEPSKTSFNNYYSQVQFSTLSSSKDSGVYTCIVDIIPLTGYTYVNAVKTTIITTSFIVRGMCFLY